MLCACSSVIHDIPVDSDMMLTLIFSSHNDIGFNRRGNNWHMPCCLPVKQQIDSDVRIAENGLQTADDELLRACQAAVHFNKRLRRKHSYLPLIKLLCQHTLCSMGYRLPSSSNAHPYIAENSLLALDRSPTSSRDDAFALLISRTRS